MYTAPNIRGSKEGNTMNVFNGKTRVLVAAVGLTGALLAACAKTSASGSGGAYGGGGTSAPPATAAGSNSIGTASVSGVGTVLTNSAGMTLYNLTTEKNGQIMCTGSCVNVWPPLLEINGQMPTVASAVTGKLATITRPDGGVQVTYDGMPLYMYSNDTATGQANGQGIDNTWFAMTPTGSSSSSGGGHSSSGGYGGY
jgi:predicted lipoprotein with Yx(FWY)xxD motif